MARDGSGNYNLPAGQPVSTGTTISSTVHNAFASDVAATLTASLAKDGQTTPSANLPMGGFKHTGVADGNALTNYGSIGQIQNGSLFLATAVGGTADAITANLAPAITGFTNGQIVVFVPTASNTAATTFAPNGLTAKTVVTPRGNNLVAADLILNRPAMLVYNSAGSEWVLMNPAHLPNSAVTGLGSLATQSGTFSGTSSGTNTGDQTITLTGDVTGTGTGSFAATLSAAAVLAKLLTVDGSGSGLDADLLDGSSSAAFATASHNHSASEITSGTLAEARGGTANGNGVARNISAKTGTAKTLSTSAASGGADGDIWYQY